MVYSATSQSSADHDAIFLECMKKLYVEKEKWESAHQSGNIATKSTAEKNITVYANGASMTVPSFVQDRTQVKKNLSATSVVFASEGKNRKKMDILKQIMPALTFCRNVKLASGLAAGAGLLALGCLAEHHTWWMSDWSLSDVIQLPHGDNETTLGWDSNNNGIIDMQQTVDNSTGIVIDSPHTITDGDILGDMIDGVVEIGTHILNFLF